MRRSDEKPMTRHATIKIDAWNTQFANQPLVSSPAKRYGKRSVSETRNP
jgi:hypothetical protein